MSLVFPNNHRLAESASIIGEMPVRPRAAKRLVALWPTFWVLLWLLGLPGVSPAGDFAAANAAFEAGKFAEARDLFVKVLESEKKISADLCYNLGCTEAKLENPGSAALWFHRALLLEPRHRDAAQNLRFLKRQEGMLAFHAEGFDALVRVFHTSTWRQATLGCAWVLGLSLASLLFLRPKRIGLLVTLLCLSAVGGILAGIGWWGRSGQVKPDKVAVVLGKEMSAYNAPAEVADTVIATPPGTQVLTLETRGKWSYVELPGDRNTRGWMRTSTLQPLWPWDVALVQ